MIGNTLSLFHYVSATDYSSVLNEFLCNPSAYLLYEIMDKAIRVFQIYQSAINIVNFLLCNFLERDDMLCSSISLIFPSPSQIMYNLCLLVEFYVQNCLRSRYCICADCLSLVNQRDQAYMRMILDAMDSASVNWNALDSLVLDYTQVEQLLLDSGTTSDNFLVRGTIANIRRLIEEGSISEALQLIEQHAPSVLQDQRLLFRLHKQVSLFT